jgi:hypothetical protein
MSRAFPLVGAVSGLLGPYELAGILCLPAGPAPSTVQVLVPGATYDHDYWDFPMSGYSYSRYAQAHGQATFAIDRFNTGDSSKLVSALVTVQVDANALHQVIGALTGSGVGGVRFSKVVTMGHSLGSIIVADEAATYHDENGVILTGFTHSLNPLFAVALAALQVLIPAQLADPDKFANQPLGDLSTAPGGAGHMVLCDRGCRPGGYRQGHRHRERHHRRRARDVPRAHGPARDQQHQRARAAGRGIKGRHLLLRPQHVRQLGAAAQLGGRPIRCCAVVHQLRPAGFRA